MNETIIVALISLIGTLIGSISGILVTNKLVNFRLEKLEKAYDEQAEIVHRVYTLEKHNDIQDTKITALEEEQDRIISDIRALRSGGK